MKKKVAAITTIALLSSTFAANAYANTYTVQKGDTLTQIARKHQTSVANLKTWNNLSSDLIFMNQTLKVANHVAPVLPPKQSAPVVVTPKQPEAPVKAPAVSTYTIAKGDTLSKIAAKHSISLSDLMKWNNLNHHIIHPGQVLKVSNASVPSGNIGSTKPKAPAAGGNVGSEKPKSPVAGGGTPTATTSYVVQKGDTLGHIGKKLGVTVQQLKEWNQLSSDLIFVGQSLKVAQSDNQVEKPVTSAPVVGNVENQNLVSVARSLLGTPYAWAGVTPTGFDCSGFIYYSFKEAGKNIGRHSTEGFYSRSYYVDAPQIGDLVFFENTYKQGISHMGIYLGNNEFIHASSASGVIISNLNQTYYKERFDGFKRFY